MTGSSPAPWSLALALGLLAPSVLAPSAYADEVHLDSGRVIEGATKVEGDRVIVALESGKIALPRRSVVRIEATRPASEIVRERESELARDDVSGLLVLADYCREHELRAKEHDLLQRVLRIDPEHATARRRLGFVRTKDGWITGPERARRAEDRALDERRRELDKKRDEIDIEKKRAELLRDEARLERERAALSEERARARAQVSERRAERVIYPSYYVAPLPYQVPQLTPPSGPPAFPIPGVRSPHDTSFSLPGVREPSTYFGDALKR